MYQNSFNNAFDQNHLAHKRAVATTISFGFSMWKKLTNESVLESIKGHSLTSLNLDSAIELITALRDKEYASQLYVVIGMGSLRLSSFSYNESKGTNGLEIYISNSVDSKYNGSLQASCKVYDGEALNFIGELLDIVDFIDRMVIRIR